MRRSILFATTLLFLTACADGDEEADSITLEGQEQPQEPEGDQAGEAVEPTEEAEAQGADGEAAEQGSGVDDPDFVDLVEAIPGTWPVGDAGTVTFSVVDGELSLDDVVPVDGWSFGIDEQGADEIEVDFRRGDVEWQIAIELEDEASILEIEIDQDIANADTGSYDIGDAGTFAFDVQDGQLVVTGLNVNDGWTITEQDEEADEIEIDLVNGPREFDVEIELEDDGTIEIEIDYEVVGPVAG